MSLLSVRKTGSSILTVLGVAALLSTLAGCALGNIELSGPPNEPNITAHANIQGKAIGGQNALTYSTIDLYTVNNSVYGGTSNLLTKVLDGTTASKFYYPGGTTGCDNTALSPSAYAIVSGTATITAVNSMIAGQLINISDPTSGLNGTYVVASATGTSFTVSTNLVDDAGIPSGSYVPICYAHPTTDQNGNFNVSGDYTCSGSSILYIQGSGGNPGLVTGTNNSSIVITALLQASPTSNVALTCASGSLSSTHVTINELTTAAMGIAMGQFFTTTYGGAPTADGFGAPSTNLTGITNAANTALELVSSWNGTANTTFVQAANGYSVTATPEATKIQTIGDILANCVNGFTANSHCSAIFGALQLNGGTTPTDTLQAAVLFGINPTAGSTTNATTLWNNVAGTSQPWTALSTQPSDWSIGIQYTDTSCSGSTCILNDPQEVLFDASGNMFVMNHNGSTSGSLSELSSLGAPVSNTSSIGATSFNSKSPRNIAIDLNGNVWLTASGITDVFEYVPSGSSVAFTSTNGPYAAVIDGSNNVFIGYESTSANHNVDEFTSDTLATNNQVEYPSDCVSSQTGYSACGVTATWNVLPQYGAIDTNGNVWFSSASSSTADAILIMSGYSFSGSTFPLINATGGDTVSETYTNYPGTASGNIPTLTSPSGLAAGPGGVVWIATGSGTHPLALMTSTIAGTNYGSSSTVISGGYPAVDGAGNVWITNGTTTSVSEFQGTGTGVGTALSPTKTGTVPYTVPGFSHTGIITPFGISIDTSGNVWVANNTVSTGGIFELVGAGAPTVNPIANQLKLGKVGVRP